MSKALYCDHCEKLMMEEHSNEVEIKLHRTKIYSPEEINLDLCSECFEQIDSWIYGKLDVNIEKNNDN